MKYKVVYGTSCTRVVPKTRVFETKEEALNFTNTSNIVFYNLYRELANGTCVWVEGNVKGR